MIGGGNTPEAAERGTGGDLRVPPAPRHPLLDVLESGQPGRFHNRTRPTVPPPVHPFHLTCDCFLCEAVWSGR